MRPPGASSADALTTSRPGPVIELDLAYQQHRAYVALLEPLGSSVVPVRLEGRLLLMSGCSYLGDGQMLAAGACASLPQFPGLGLLLVPEEEAEPANSLTVGDQGSSRSLASGCRPI